MSSQILWFTTLGVLVVAVGSLAITLGCRRVPKLTNAIPDSVHSYSLPLPAGGEQSLAQYRGKTVLLVNTASKCGFTSQYESLEKLQKTYGPRGFTVIAVPCNDFLGQEPGSNQEIQEFCRTTYQTTFPVMGKISVTGSKSHELYRYLVHHSPFPGAISWNFTKFLINPEGEVVHRFGPRTSPEDPQVIQAIEGLLPAQAL